MYELKNITTSTDLLGISIILSDRSYHFSGDFFAINFLVDVRVGLFRNNGVFDFSWIESSDWNTHIKIIDAKHSCPLAGSLTVWIQNKYGMSIDNTSRWYNPFIITQDWMSKVNDGSAMDFFENCIFRHAKNRICNIANFCHGVVIGNFFKKVPENKEKLLLNLKEKYSNNSVNVVSVRKPSGFYCNNSVIKMNTDDEVAISAFYHSNDTYSYYYDVASNQENIFKNIEFFSAQKEFYRNSVFLYKGHIVTISFPRFCPGITRVHPVMHLSSNIEVIKMLALEDCSSDINLRDFFETAHRADGVLEDLKRSGVLVNSAERLLQSAQDYLDSSASSIARERKTVKSYSDSLLAIELSLKGLIANLFCMESSQLKDFSHDILYMVKFVSEKGLTLPNDLKKIPKNITSIKYDWDIMSTEDQWVYHLIAQNTFNCVIGLILKNNSASLARFDKVIDCS